MERPFPGVGCVNESPPVPALPRCSGMVRSPHQDQIDRILHVMDLVRLLLPFLRLSESRRSLSKRLLLPLMSADGVTRIAAIRDSDCADQLTRILHAAGNVPA